MPLVGCTENVIHKTADPAPVAPEPEQTTEPTDPPPATPDPKAPTSSSKAPEDRCLDGQDMDGADVDLKACPELPDAPEETLMGKATIDLGAWEMGTTSDGQNYKYGSLSGANPRMLNFEGGKAAVNDQNVECWAKGYYRLRKMLQTPPAAYVALHKAGFQYRFFQFQTDLRNGKTGYTEISSFQDHLVKWVTIVDTKGACKQPTLTQFREYAEGELTARSLPVPKE